MMTTKIYHYDNIDTDEAKKAIIKYNSGDYNGHLNVSLDRTTLALFRQFHEENSSVKIYDLLLYISKYYGGMDRCGDKDRERVCKEIADRVNNHTIGGHDYMEYIKRIHNINYLLGRNRVLLYVNKIMIPFLNIQTKLSNNRRNWPVLASKFLHFMNNKTFPIMDRKSRVFYKIKKDGISHTQQYLECIKIVNQILSGESKMCIRELRKVDGEHYQGDIKMIDKIAHTLGG